LALCFAWQGATGLFISALTEQLIGATTAGVLINVLSFILELSWMHEWLPTHWWVSFGELLRDPIAWDALGRGLLTAGRLRPGLTGSPRGRGSPARTSRADAGTGSAAAGSRRHLVVVAAGSALQVARLPRRGRTPAPFPSDRGGTLGTRGVNGGRGPSRK
jgi:hypothetical protein